MNQDQNKSNLKGFIIRLIAITLSIIVVINVTYNLIFADKLEGINKILSINNKEKVEIVKDKIRLEIKKGLKKDKILNDEDKILLFKLYTKIKNEFGEIDNNWNSK